VSLVKRAGDMPVDRFGESDGAIVERDVQLSAIERSFSNFVNLRLIKFYRAETQVEILSRIFGVRMCSHCDTGGLRARADGNGGEEDCERNYFDSPTHGLTGLGANPEASISP